MRSYTTADGGTIEVRHAGARWFDLHVRNAAGSTVATVSLSEDDLYALLADAKEELNV